jgi:hypothetical protein
MNTEPDVIDICIAVCASLIDLDAATKRALDLKLRHEIGGERRLVARKQSPFLRVEIRARYDGTMATTRLLAKEYGVSECTVRRIGHHRAAARPAAPSPKLTQPPVPPRPIKSAK